MRWRPVGVAVVPLAMLLCAGPVGAQRGEDACVYETCALRATARGWFSGPKVVRGAEGVRVSRFDRSEALERLFATSGSARARYAAFARDDRRADRLEVVASLLIVAAGLAAGRDASWDRPWALGLLGGGIVFGVAAVAPRRHATDALHEAIWWYNASLPHRGGGR